jgi:hypothetical protein
MLPRWRREVDGAVVRHAPERKPQRARSRVATRANPRFRPNGGGHRRPRGSSSNGPSVTTDPVTGWPSGSRRRAVGRCRRSLWR